MDLFDSWWKMLIIVAVLIILFGSKKLPDAARSLGKSMRIMKSEVRGLHEDEEPEPTRQAPNQQQPPQQQQQQIAQLQQQIRELQQSAAGEPAASNGTPVTEAQRTQQPS